MGWGKPSAMQIAEDEARDRAPLVTSCGLCDWTFSGTAGEGRLASFEHRKTHAVNTIGRPKQAKQKPVKHLSQGLTADDRREAIQKMTDQPDWNERTVIAALQDWAQEHDGKPPTSTQWQGNKIAGDYPPTWKVLGVFGKWSKAIAAAGLNGVATNGAHEEPEVDRFEELVDADGEIEASEAVPVADEIQGSVIDVPPADPHGHLGAGIVPLDASEIPRRPELLTLVELATEAQECREMLESAQDDYRDALARLAVAVSEAAAA